MTVYIGVDFHARQQTISYLTTEDGEIQRTKLDHLPEDIQHQNVRSFYSQFNGKVIVGFEAGGYSQWFESMLEELGHEIWVGDAAEIRRLARRKQKNDKRDANLILELMVTERFPRLQRRSALSREILRQIGYRHKLVKMRTMSKNGLKAIALGAGLVVRSQFYSQRGRAMLERLKLTPSVSRQAEDLIELIDQLNKKIKRVEEWLSKEAAKDERVKLLQTQPGIGLLTSLALVNMLEPVERFSTARKVTAYIGMDPVEDSSGDRKRIGSISKSGSRLMRFLLSEAAQVAIQKDDELRKFFYRVMKRRNTPKAIVAVGRKLLVRSFIMLRDGIDAEEFARRGVKARSSRVAHRPSNA
jgi:transposase